MYKVPHWVLESQLKLLEKYEKHLMKQRNRYSLELKEVRSQIKLLKDNFYV
jgi:hypothetical protein